MTDEISLGSLLKDVSPQDIDSVLATFTKYEKIFDKGIATLEKLEKLGILPAMIRSVGAKTGVIDLDKPLQNPLTFTSKTPAHYEFYRLLNDIPEEVIEEMHHGLLDNIKKAKENEETLKEETEIETEPVKE